MPNSKQSPARYIILDTNIFQHFGNKTLADKIIENLRYAVSKGYGLSMSQFSVSWNGKLCIEIV